MPETQCGYVLSTQPNGDNQTETDERYYHHTDVTDNLHWYDDVDKYQVNKQHYMATTGVPKRQGQMLADRST